VTTAELRKKIRRREKNQMGVEAFLKGSEAGLKVKGWFWGK